MPSCIEVVVAKQSFCFESFREFDFVLAQRTLSLRDATRFTSCVRVMATLCRSLGALRLHANAGAVPARFGWSGWTVDLATYFSMARRVAREGRDEPAMKMTK